MRQVYSCGPVLSTTVVSEIPAYPRVRFTYDYALVESFGPVSAESTGRICQSPVSMHDILTAQYSASDSAARIGSLEKDQRIAYL